MIIFIIYFNIIYSGAQKYSHAYTYKFQLIQRGELN